MKKYHLLFLLCCISNINIFSAEKKSESLNEKEKREVIENINYVIQEEYKHKEKEKNINEHCKNNSEIAQLEDKYKREIAAYEQTISALMAERESKDAEINRLKYNR